MAQQISVRVPATCANLGCAFDCAALALGLYLRVHVRPRSDGAVNVRYTGVTPERVPTDHTNLIARTIRNTLEGWHKARGFDLEIENQIPVGVGLGSSAAAIVGALAACHWMADTALSDEELVSMATRLEGHPDNAAAAWHGGFTVAAEQRGAVLAYPCPARDLSERGRALDTGFCSRQRAGHRGAGSSVARAKRRRVSGPLSCRRQHGGEKLEPTG